MPLSKIKTNSVADEVFETGPNLIQNGSMAVSQRGSSFSFAHDGTRSAYTLDRFSFSMRSTSDEFDCTVAQVTDAPAGFSKSLKLTTGTAESAVGSDEYYNFYHPIEAQNLQHLQHGTSGAKKVTVSFYVKSSITGTFGFSAYKADNTPRVIAKTYTISSANTWERKEITIEGDTSQSIDNDNGGGMWLYWMMGAGTDFNSGASTTTWADYGSGTTWFQASATKNVVTTASATWQLTGVQLEVGEKATPFQHESYGATLRKCQRYYFPAQNYNIYSGWAMTWGSGTQYPKVNADFPVPMRAAPSITYGQSNSGTANQIEWVDGSTTGASSWGVGVNGIYYVFTPSNIAANISGQFRYTADAEI